MGLRTESQFREPTAIEQAFLQRLLEAEFPGKRELAALLRNVLVRTIDENGGLELESQIEGIAPVVKRVPVEAEGRRRRLDNPHASACRWAESQLS